MTHLQTAPLSVVHVVETCCGGVATFVAQLITSQMADPLFSKVHLLHDNQGTEEKVLRTTPDTSIYTSSRNPLKAWRIAREIHARLAEIGPDVVVLHSSFPGFWGRMFRGPWKTIYCPHGWAFTQDFHPLAKKIYAEIERLFSHRCEAIVSISHDEFRLGDKAGVRTDIHEVIRHGLPPAHPAESPILPLDQDALNLAFVGRFERQKGLDVLLQFFDDAALDHITLWLVGEDFRGVSRQDLPSRSNIRALGWLSSGQVDKVLSQVDALVMPSRTEGFGLAALEAMRMKKPVIANRVGGLSELVVEGVNGRFINIRDITASRAVLAGLTKAELATMGEAALGIFEREFRWDVCYGKWREFIARVAAG